MIFYMLVFSLKVGLLPPTKLPAEAKLDTMLNGDVFYRYSTLVQSPAQASVKMLNHKQGLLYGDSEWTGELFLLDLFYRTVTPIKLIKIQSASDTLRWKTSGEYPFQHTEEFKR